MWCNERDHVQTYRRRFTQDTCSLSLHQTRAITHIHAITHLSRLPCVTYDHRHVLHRRPRKARDTSLQLSDYREHERSILENFLHGSPRDTCIPMLRHYSPYPLQEQFNSRKYILDAFRLCPTSLCCYMIPAFLSQLDDFQQPKLEFRYFRVVHRRILS